MSGDVVDVNVLRTANGEADHASLDCQISAIDYLMYCRATNNLVLDADYLIMQLYAVGCSHSGQPGVGDQFFVWTRDNIGNVEQAAIITNEDRGFESFPQDEALRAFDWDDRVYVATALATDPKSRLVNSVDSDYSEQHDAFSECGLHVVELCPDDLHGSDRQ